MTIATVSAPPTAPMGPTIARLAAPNLIAVVVGTVTLMAEAWYAGQFGTESLAGPALTCPMMMLVMMLSARQSGCHGDGCQADWTIPAGTARAATSSSRAHGLGT